MSTKLIVSPSPHIKDNATTSSIMLDVIIALMPTLIAAVYIFGNGALLLTAVCVITAVVSEYLFQRVNRRPCTVGDLSAVVTGLLLAFNLPLEMPLWMAAFGSVVAIVVVKQLFGGIGQNFANPAITARIVLLASFSGPMAKYLLPILNTSYSTDLVAGATPLAILAGESGVQSASSLVTILGGDAKLGLPNIFHMLIGVRGGCIGETFAIGLIAGGLYLMYRKVISPIIPLTYIATVGISTLVLGQAPIYQMVSGGLLIGAFFMATDYSTSPTTKKGKLIFGIGCGLLTVLIRVYGSFPEGVSFAILLMNIITPLINRYTINKPFGGAR